MSEEGLPNVNKETLELLQRRIESNVRSNFLKTVTIPIGGGGIIAIVFAVVTWIPTQIKSILNEDYVKKQVTSVADEEVRSRVLEQLDTVVADRMEYHVNGYFETEKGSRLLAAEVERNVKTYLGGDDGRKLLAAEVKESVKAYLDGVDGRSVLAEEVKRVFQDEQVRTLVSKTVSMTATTYIEGDLQQVIKQTVRTELQPTVEAATRRVREKSDQLVIKFVGDAQGASIQIAKGGVRELADIENNADYIRSTKLPVILTKNVGIGPYYDKAMIKSWIDKFHKEFPDQFQHVVILYGGTRGQGRFVALVQYDQFKKQLDDSDELINLLRMSADQISFEKTQERILPMFGPQSTRHIKLTETVKQVLRNSGIWLRDTKPSDKVAVINPEENDLLVGLTNRETLEESLFVTTN